MAVNFKTESLQKHKDLADKIKSGLVAEGSTIKEQESHSSYFGNLPEGLDRETVESVAKYNNDFVSAAHVAIGELSADLFRNDKEIDKVQAQVGFFGKRDKITATVNRSKTYKNNFAEKEEDKELTKHLVISSTVETSGYGLKSIREAMSTEFAGKFAK